MTAREYRCIDGVPHHQCLTCTKWKPSTREHFYGAGGRHANGRSLLSECIPCRTERYKQRRAQRMAVSAPFTEARERAVAGLPVFTFEGKAPPRPTLASMLAQLDR